MGFLAVSLVEQVLEVQARLTIAVVDLGGVILTLGVLFSFDVVVSGLFFFEKVLGGVRN